MEEVRRVLPLGGVPTLLGAVGWVVSSIGLLAGAPGTPGGWACACAASLALLLVGVWLLLLPHAVRREAGRLVVAPRFGRPRSFALDRARLVAGAHPARAVLELALLVGVTLLAARLVGVELRLRGLWVLVLVVPYLKAYFAWRTVERLDAQDDRGRVRLDLSVFHGGEALLEVVRAC